MNNINKNSLINMYKGLLIDIFKEYRKFFEINTGYYNYKNDAFVELEKIANSFEILKNKKINVTNVFKDEYNSILHAVDSILFNHMKSIFENVKNILEIK